jgi:hypothetical protein
MTINIIETKFDIEKVTENMLMFDPTEDMHAIEDWENRLDEIAMPYALVECRKVTNKKDEFLGYSLVTQLVLTRTAL